LLSVSELAALVQALITLGSICNSTRKEASG